MGNASFSYANPTINYDERTAFTDETNIASASMAGPGSSTQSATWFLKLSGMYQLPAGFSIAGFFQAREGYVFATDGYPFGNPCERCWRFDVTVPDQSTYGDQRLPYVLEPGSPRWRKTFDRLRSRPGPPHR